MTYWIIRNILKWVSKITKQQCSGKRRSGLALEWCSKRAFHDGVCTAWNGKEFSDGREASK
jgi:hypothetical protein